MEVENGGDGTAALNFLGADTAKYQRYYTLKSTKYENSWDYLVKVCDVLNNTPINKLYDSISNYMNLDATLWYLATETLFSDDDSYVFKGKMDYYLYLDDETGLIQPIEFDGNSAMHKENSKWALFYNAEKENYPLMNRLFKIPEIRQRYLAHVRTILNDSFDEVYTSTLIDNFVTLIDNDVKTDNKTPYTYSQYKTSIIELKEFISTRKQFLFSNSELNKTPASITNVICETENKEWETPFNNQELTFSVNAIHQDGIKEVNLFICNQLFGNFTKHTMNKNGDSYSIVLNKFNKSEYIRFYFEAVSNNTEQSRTYEPVGAEHSVYYLNIKTPIVESEITINELMASNLAYKSDQDGEYDDWIELYNNSNIKIDLTGYCLSDNPDNLTKYKIPDGTQIEGGSFLVFWADEDGSQEGLHTNFKLSNSGETIYLITPDLEIADQVSFDEGVSDQSYSRIPNGTGGFDWQHASFGYNNEAIVSEKNQLNNITASYKIYPNPAESILYIDFDSPLQISIFSIEGRKIQNYRTSQNSQQTMLDISQLKKGLYIISIITENKTTTQKIIIQ